MPEAHGIRNTVIGTVLGGLLLTLILWILDLLKPSIHAIWNVLQLLVAFLAATIEIPVWLTVLVTVALATLLLVLVKLRAEHSKMPAAHRISPAEREGSLTMSLDGLQEPDRHMLSVLYAADSDPVDVPTLAG